MITIYISIVLPLYPDDEILTPHFSTFHFIFSAQGAEQLLCFNNHMGKYTHSYLYIYHIDSN